MIGVGYVNRTDNPGSVAVAAPPAAATASAPRAGVMPPGAPQGRTLVSWLAAIPKCLGAHLFVMGDAEAGWRGWQITSVHGGLGRRYRDPLFSTLRLS